MGAILMLLVYIMIFAGWVMNLVQVVEMASGELTALLIIKLVGIPIGPLGVVMGWIG